MAKKLYMLSLILLFFICFSGPLDAKLLVIGTATIKGDTGSAPEGHPGSAAGPAVAGSAGGKTEYNLIYEDDTGLIWLDYTHTGQSWFLQVAWAAGLNEAGVLTYRLEPGISVSWEGDWRLPETADGARRFGYSGNTTAGFNITTSDLGHLYYRSLGNMAYYDTDGELRPGWYPDSDWGPKNTEPFNNLHGRMYWSGTEYSINPQLAWVFNFAFGDQSNNALKHPYPYFGIAVRPGKVVRK